MKDLPKPKKSLKNFILGEDAKIIDKAVSKVAIGISFLGFTILDSNLANANHTNHSNNLVIPDKNSSIISNPDSSAEIFENPKLINPGQLELKDTISSNGQSIRIVNPPENLQAIHANHNNYTSGGGSS